MQLVYVKRPFEFGHVDVLELDASGLVRLIGWSSRDMDPGDFHVQSGGKPTRPLCAYRLPRPDVAKALRTAEPDLGFCLEYLRTQDGDVEVRQGSKRFALVKPEEPILPPDYAPLFAHALPLARENIYSAGPPTPQVHPEILAFARRLSGPVLDFGCGSGSLVRELVQAGVEARGLELDRPEIHASIRPDVEQRIRLYGGGFPAPFSEGEFASVVCSEVLEHIPDLADAIREIARLARTAALITVPDMSAIPMLCRHHVIPWHLLEATHVNFFTQASLEAALRPVFRTLRMSRMGEFHVNGTRVYTSLVALCQR
jgi:SAM-dependent methyltransferase